MADASRIRHPAAEAVRPSYQEPALRQGWGTGGSGDRPVRLTQHAQREEADTGSLAAALGAIALVLIATAVMVIAFAF